MSNYQASTGALKLEPISYRSQVVAGRNLFIKVIFSSFFSSQNKNKLFLFNIIVKVDTGSHDYIHIRVFVPLPVYGTEPQLQAIQFDKTLEDPIEYIRANQNME